MGPLMVTERKNRKLLPFFAQKWRAASVRVPAFPARDAVKLFHPFKATKQFVPPDEAIFIASRTLLETDDCYHGLH